MLAEVREDSRLDESVLEDSESRDFRDQVVFYGAAKSQMDMSQMTWKEVQTMKESQKRGQEPRRQHKKPVGDQVSMSENYLSPTMSYQRLSV